MEKKNQENKESKKKNSKIQDKWKKFDERRKENKAELEEIRRSKNKKNRTQIIMGVIFTIAMTVLVVSMILSFGDIKAIGETFGRIANDNNWVYLLAAFALLMVYFFLWPRSLVTFSRALGVKDHNKEIYEIGAIEHFYNDVTPSAAGGQPFQIYALKTIGVDTGKATGAVLMTYLMFLMVTNLYALIGLVFFPFYLQGVAEGSVKAFQMVVSPELFIWIAVVGYVLNLLNLFNVFLLGKSRTVRYWIIKLCLWICKFKLGKKFLRPHLKTFVDYCHNTQNAFKEISTHKKHFVKAFLLRFLAMGAFYSIPFFLLLAVGLPFENAILGFFVILFGTSFAITAVSWLPTPGTTGGIEIAFSVVLASLIHMSGIVSNDFDFTSFDADAVTLLWRMFTYYLRIILSFGMSIIFEIQLTRKLRKEKAALAAKEAESLKKEEQLEHSLTEEKEQ